MLWDFFFMLVDAWICVISPLLLVYVVDIRVHKPWGECLRGYNCYLVCGVGGQR